MKIKYSQSGVSLYLAIIILAVLLAISLGLNAILVSQIKMVRGIEESVVALYAADTGIERMLRDFNGGTAVPDTGIINLPNNSSYVAQIRCQPGQDPCSYGVDPNCDGPRYCIKSKGLFGQTQRAIEVEY